MLALLFGFMIPNQFSIKGNAQELCLLGKLQGLIIFNF